VKEKALNTELLNWNLIKYTPSCHTMIIDTGRSWNKIVKTLPASFLLLVVYVGLRIIIAVRHGTCSKLTALL